MDGKTSLPVKLLLTPFRLIGLAVVTVHELYEILTLKGFDFSADSDVASRAEGDSLDPEDKFTSRALRRVPNEGCYTDCGCEVICQAAIERVNLGAGAEYEAEEYWSD